MSQEDGKLIDAIADSIELEIFTTDLVINLVDYRWEKFAKVTHTRGLLVHITYILVLTMYIRSTYLGSSIDIVPSTGYLYAIALCLLYPLIYDGTQFMKQGPSAYLRSIWNYNDVFHILGGYFNIYIQIQLGPKHVVC
jgi:hypothetical protein